LKEELGLGLEKKSGGGLEEELGLGLEEESG